MGSYPVIYDVAVENGEQRKLVVVALVLGGAGIGTTIGALFGGLAGSFTGALIGASVGIIAADRARAISISIDRHGRFLARIEMR